MTAAGPRITGRLLQELRRLDDRRLPIAEVCRRVGEAAERLGRPRPSYEQVRVLVHEWRRLSARPTTAEVAADVVFRVRPPEALLDHVSGIGVPPR